MYMGREVRNHDATATEATAAKRARGQGNILIAYLGFRAFSTRGSAGSHRVPCVADYMVTAEQAGMIREMWIAGIYMCQV